MGNVGHFNGNIEILELLNQSIRCNGTTASGMGIIDYPFDYSDLKLLLIDDIDSLARRIKRFCLMLIFAQNWDQILLI